MHKKSSKTSQSSSVGSYTFTAGKAKKVKDTKEGEFSVAGIEYFSTNRLPKLTYNRLGIDQGIEVVLTSSQDEDEALLHKLFKKIKP